jgi:hypothetical protein
LNAEICFQLEDGKISKGRVTQRVVGPDGKQYGMYKNSITYEAEFDDGAVREYSANVIAENMISQYDSDGYALTMIQAIIDFTKDETTYSKVRLRCDPPWAETPEEDNPSLETAREMGGCLLRAPRHGYRSKTSRNQICPNWPSLLNQWGVHDEPAFVW